MLRVFIQTYGCQMNEADSEEMFLHLSARGAVRTDQLANADAVLINTCTVRGHAEHRALSFLGRLAKWKREDPRRIIIFAGCAAQRMGQALQKRYPYLNIVSGAKEIENFSHTLDKSGLFTTSGPAAMPASNLSAYVTIMRGCNFNCTYCIVPSVRGPVKCLPAQDILAEVKRKAQAGAKEIMLLGQTVNAYQEDGVSFAELLNRVSEIPGVERIRFTSPHPLYFTDELLRTLTQNPVIARHIHLPVQSGSNAVLQAMKRGYTRELFLEKINALQAAGCHITTDIIVGFPTETETDFEQTLSLVDQAQFLAAYCFKYSPRQGTPAAQMTLHPENVLEKRLSILLNKVRDLSQTAYKRQVGTTQQVLMETPHKGRASGSFWVQTKNPHPVGNMVSCKVVAAEGTLLFCEE